MTQGELRFLDGAGEAAGVDGGDRTGLPSTGRGQLRRATEVEEKSRLYRGSLYIVRDLQAGDVLTPDNLRIIRPGFGLPPKYYAVLLGKRVNREVRRGTAVDWTLMG